MIKDTLVGFSKGKAYPGRWLSDLICWATGSIASHTFIIYWNEPFRCYMVCEASEIGIRDIPYDKFSQINEVVAVYRPKQDITSGLAKAHDRMADSYYYLGLFGMAFVAIGRWLKKKWDNPFRNTKSLFCSEWDAIVLMAASYPNVDHWDPINIEPVDVLNLLAKDGSQVVDPASLLKE